MSMIKCRAWDKENKIMRKVTSLFFEPQSMEIILVNCPALKKEGSEMLLGDKCIVMQFTGLYDKNGKEIYEGDIINLGEKGFAKPEIIVFSNGAFGIYPSWINQKEKPKHLYENPTFVELNKYCNDIFINCVEVIGNIYENPELMEG